MEIKANINRQILELVSRPNIAGNVCVRIEQEERIMAAIASDEVFDAVEAASDSANDQTNDEEHQTDNDSNFCARKPTLYLRL